MKLLKVSDPYRLPFLLANIGTLGWISFVVCAFVMYKYGRGDTTSKSFSRMVVTGTTTGTMVSTLYMLGAIPGIDPTTMITTLLVGMGSSLALYAIACGFWLIVFYGIRSVFRVIASSYGDQNAK